MQFQAVDILIQVGGSLVDLRVRVPFLEALVGYTRASGTGSKLAWKESHV